MFNLCEHLAWCFSAPDRISVRDKRAQKKRNVKAATWISSFVYWSMSSAFSRHRPLMISRSALNCQQLNATLGLATAAAHSPDPIATANGQQLATAN